MSSEPKVIENWGLSPYEKAQYFYDKGLIGEQIMQIIEKLQEQIIKLGR